MKTDLDAVLDLVEPEGFRVEGESKEDTLIRIAREYHNRFGELKDSKINANYLEELNCYLPAFMEEMDARLTEKFEKYGNAWKNRPVEYNGEWQHQNIRMFNWLHEKLDAWENGGEDINWIDVANEALICWVRENENSTIDSE